MKQRFTLAVANPTLTVSLDFNAHALTVYNRSKYAIYIRVGASDTPTEGNADISVAPASGLTVPVDGRDFALALAGTTDLGDVTLADSATILFYDKSENPPAMGGLSFANLSATDNLGGPWQDITDGQILGPFDLDRWGGLLAYIQGGSDYGGRVSVQTSVDGVIYAQVGLYPIWPRGGISLSLPRLGRYTRLLFGKLPVDGWTGYVAAYGVVRATLTEVLETRAVPDTRGYYVVALAGGESRDFYFDGLGAEAINLTIRRTQYNYANAARVDVYIAADLYAYGPLYTMSLYKTLSVPVVQSSVIGERVPCNGGPVKVTVVNETAGYSEIELSAVPAMGTPAPVTEPLKIAQAYVDVTVASTLIAAAKNRRYALIVNDGAYPVYLAVTGAAAVANQGIRLNPGGSAYELSTAFGNVTHFAIYAIALGGTSRVTVTEA